MSNLERYETAIARGDYNEALQALKAEMIVAENSPNEIIWEKGKSLKFKRRGRFVEQGPGGLWYPIKKITKQ